MSKRIASDLFPEGGFTLEAPKQQPLPPFCKEGEHDFKVVHGFVGRYRCQKCEALGFKEAALDRMTRAARIRAKEEGIDITRIQLYKCPKCGGPTACYQGARYTVTDRQSSPARGARTCRVCLKKREKK